MWRVAIASVLLMICQTRAMDGDVEQGWLARPIGTIQTDETGPDVAGRTAIEKWADTIRIVDGSRRELADGIVDIWRASVNERMTPARCEVGRLRRQLCCTRVAAGLSLVGMFVTAAAFCLCYFVLSPDCPSGGTPTPPLST